MWTDQPIIGSQWDKKLTDRSAALSVRPFYRRGVVTLAKYLLQLEQPDSIKLIGEPWNAMDYRWMQELADASFLFFSPSLFSCPTVIPVGQDLCTNMY